MRIQFVRVPAAGIFGESSEKVLMCVSEIKGKVNPKDFDDYMQKRLGVAGVLITDQPVVVGPDEPSLLPKADLTAYMEQLKQAAEQLAADAPAPEPEVGYFCANISVGGLEVSPGSKHGPCQYISCCLDHCRCSHAAPPAPMIPEELWNASVATPPECDCPPEEPVIHRCTRTRTWHSPSDTAHKPCRCLKAWAAPEHDVPTNHCRCEHD